MYVLIRGDIPLAQQAVQACHAGITAARQLFPSDEVHPSLVLCTVPDRFALVRAALELNRRGIHNKVFHEEDLGGEPTALATEPVTGDDRKAFSNYPLLKGA